MGGSRVSGAQDLVQKSQNALNAARLRVSGTLLGTGLFSALFCAVIWVTDLYLPKDIPPAFFLSFLGVPGAIMAMLSVLPTDARLIRGGLALLSLLFTALGIYTIFSMAGLTSARSSTVWDCDWGTYRRAYTCYKGFTTYCGASIAFLTGGFGLLPVFRRGVGAPRRCDWHRDAVIMKQQWESFHLSQGGGLVGWAIVLLGLPLTSLPPFWLERHPNYYKMPARAALEHAWLLIRVMCLVFAVTQFVGFALEFEDDLAIWADRKARRAPPLAGSLPILGG